ncbi:chromosome partitioning protein ParA [Aurantimonas sp. 22II-16-19i]|uniref:chromosome partitioning protein ParA n=1 Tax=Aurantimonas sp. 22II-16-19i TaxID=1317114 RepID=UPI0009F7CD23|nr:chromosome partitioning protein ParA [Aurantimonas sp. 22II-16-19i]ORE97628.1 ParA-like protein [Aurantimonas sp. 22II-16-19i]
MISVVSVGSLKTSGSSTVALTLASVAAAAEIPVLLIDAARDGDLADWAARGGVPSKIWVERSRDAVAMDRLVRAACKRGDLVVIDAGDEAAMIRQAARLSDRALIPVRFSPLSAHAAVETDRMLAEEAGRGRRPRDRCFVASAVATIPSRIARSLETIIAESATARLPIGLVQRAAYEAPFLFGGTIFTLEEEIAPGLDRARAEAASLAYEIGILGTRQEKAAPARREMVRKAA